ncbi:hypothetical protein KCP91_15925 [Microvirga sp. SRT01]|uniref:Uncharacterized protein n=1 Tax=Sphingomonas longa TaxID=2778730 RepID=A0ABS2DAF7_9SPHN|nr:MULTISPECIES: hypothetical protein [Alphaproteobacteria]MBM6577873.1 hypothetical protein [Sphingomonas sp. BT552]MBR7710914.1 hypothetical protein [Microvirga sp. SRT01]
MSKNVLLLDDLICVIQQIDSIIDAMSIAMLSSSDHVGADRLKELSDALSSAVKVAKSVPDRDTYTAFINNEGLLQVGSETRTLDLTTDQIDRLQRFGLF